MTSSFDFDEILSMKDWAWLNSSEELVIEMFHEEERPAANKTQQELPLWNSALKKINNAVILMSPAARSLKRRLENQQEHELRKTILVVAGEDHTVTEVIKQEEPSKLSVLGNVQEPKDDLLGSWNPTPIVNLYGESRLRITFLNFGNAGKIKQRFGRGSSLIPDGIVGRHEMYEQQWRFDVIHEVENGVVLIIWKITNVISGTVTAVKETAKQAHIREISGRTICNKVVKTALETRAVELEKQLASGMPEQKSKRASVKNLITILRPKMCTVGLLFFGLLHEAVQSRFLSKE